MEKLTSSPKKLKKELKSEIQKKIRLASELLEFAYRIKSHQLKLKHPEWTAEQIKQMTLELISKGTR